MIIMLQLVMRVLILALLLVLRALLVVRVVRLPAGVVAEAHPWVD
jgi:hypothetical protein